MRKQYKSLWRQVREHENVCVPVAVSICTGIPINKVIKAAERAGKTKKYGMQYRQILKMLKILGYKMELMPHTGKTGITFKASEDCIVRYKKHFAAYKNGRLDDGTDGRRFKVLACYKLIKRRT